MPLPLIFRYLISSTVIALLICSNAFVTSISSVCLSFSLLIDLLQIMSTSMKTNERGSGISMGLSK
jgi:hypothetical protein